MIIGKDNQLLCPLCGDEYTHLEAIEKYREKDGRLCAKLHFYCECGHEFCADFQQHEGMTFIESTYKEVRNVL